MLWKLFGYDNREAACVRYDGIYVYRRGPVTSGLRFYNDGLVCAASSPTADEIMGLILCRENIGKARGLSSGEYSIHDYQISFQSASRYGKVDYKGVIKGGGMVLSTYSHINGHRETNVLYRFVKLEPQYLDPANLRDIDIL